MAITLIFTMGDTTSLEETDTRQPFIQLFYNATRSLGAATVMTVIVVIMLSACCISEVATASRQLRSFARDGGLPFSEWLAVVWAFVSEICSSLC
jgi:choline transport protein